VVGYFEPLLEHWRAGRDLPGGDHADGLSDGITTVRPRTTVDRLAKKTFRPNSRRTNRAQDGHSGRSRDHLQNRWSASLAMSTDGSFPSRPRQF
jgi:hypothetical protein